MIQENIKEQLVESWLSEPGYVLAANRMELLARILVVNNPLFAAQDFSNLKVLDIGCGGGQSAAIKSEHQFDLQRLWEPWFLRIAYLLDAGTRDGIDVVPQTREDNNYKIYNHITADIFKAFLRDMGLENLWNCNPRSYNLINCTNVIDPEKFSPYLENLLNNLGMQSQVEDIAKQLFQYIYNFALIALEEEGILAIDTQFYIKKDGILVNLLEQ